MRDLLRAAVIGLATFALTALPSLAADAIWEYAVQVSSVVQSSPAQITLSWPQDGKGVPTSYTLYRKTPGAASWGDALATLPGSTTAYTDTTVSTGAAYEYRVIKLTPGYKGYGYVQTGIEAPLVENRGKVILVVDDSHTRGLAFEIARLETDLIGDGWTVLRRDVSRQDSVRDVKAVIKAAYETDPANVKSVFLLGHIPVPYSGHMNPDGHSDHIGAWPADVYYGDIDGDWTDHAVNYRQTLNTDPVDAARMSNVPGDGKFDQNKIPSVIELEVGRVDLANMPGRVTPDGPATFANEQELLRKYLNKDHRFRHRITSAPRRAIIGDYFGARGGEAFAASGFRSFAPLVGASHIRNLNVEFNDQKGVWVSAVAQNDYLLAYGCGPGSYSTLAGLGNIGDYHDGSTVEMVNHNVRGVFNLIFGSWLGDWDHEDNALRAPLVTDFGLVSVWSGRPHWFLHPLGLGETMGHITRLTQNNHGHYETAVNSSANRVHIALMGDPTLRLHPVAPAGVLHGTTMGSTVALRWSPSVDPVLGYHVYRQSAAGEAFTRLTAALVTTTTFSDLTAALGGTYMVRAVKLESTPSGSYHNPSQGVFWSAEGGSVGGDIIATAPATLSPTLPLVTTPVTSTLIAAIVSHATVASAPDAAASVALPTGGPAQRILHRPAR